MLQGTIGNAAVVSLLSSRRGDGLNVEGVHRLGTTGPAIQRLLAPGSDPALSDMYEEMLDASATFEELDQKMPQDRPLLLVDSSTEGRHVPSQEVGATDYNHQLNRIRVPLRLTSDQVARSKLLFEMHNAVNRPRFVRTQNFLNSFSAEEVDLLGPYLWAAMALAVEWDEWTSAAEFSVRRRRINQDLGSGMVVSRRGEEAFFAEPGKGWFLFVNCLAYERARGHTRHYDSAESSTGWAGESILRIALSSSPASLRITDKEYEDFRRGRRTSIKHDGHNPFKTRAVVLRAADENGRGGVNHPAGRPPWSR